MTQTTDLLAPVWTHLTNIQPERAEGIYFYDADGTRYTDFTSGIGVTNTGHCHPCVVQAVRDQAGQLIFGQMNIVMAKGLGSGLPISAIASRAELMAKWTPGTHGGTYGGGSAIASAAANATIDVIIDEALSIFNDALSAAHGGN